MSNPVSEYMTRMPHTIGEGLPTVKAKEMMSQYSCHHLPVLSGGHLVGILSDRDIRVAEKANQQGDITVSQIMTDEPVVVEPTEDVFQVAMLMHQKKIGSVIVSATEESPWGIFTATDALRFLTNR